MKETKKVNPEPISPSVIHDKVDIALKGAVDAAVTALNIRLENHNWEINSVCCIKVHAIHANDIVVDAVIKKFKNAGWHIIPLNSETYEFRY